MTVAVDQEKEMAEFRSDSKQIAPSDYGCQILLEKTTIEAANDKSFPNDARLIWYIVDGVEYVEQIVCPDKTYLMVEPVVDDSSVEDDIEAGNNSRDLG